LNKNLLDMFERGAKSIQEAEEKLDSAVGWKHAINIAITALDLCIKQEAVNANLYAAGCDTPGCHNAWTKRENYKTARRILKKALLTFRQDELGFDA
jgi:hypothetical protein